MKFVLEAKWSNLKMILLFQIFWLSYCVFVCIFGSYWLSRYAKVNRTYVTVDFWNIKVVWFYLRGWQDAFPKQVHDIKEKITDQ